jgi:hypothetical protein
LRQGYNNLLIPLVSVSAGELNLYPGVGVGGGYEWRGGSLLFNEWGDPYVWTGAAFIGVAGMIGIE